jgi:hypothetical protein
MSLNISSTKPHDAEKMQVSEHCTVQSIQQQILIYTRLKNLQQENTLLGVIPRTLQFLQGHYRHIHHLYQLPKATPRESPFDAPPDPPLDWEFPEHRCGTVFASSYRILIYFQLFHEHTISNHYFLVYFVL